MISQFRFTNAYRAADRVSQDLIRVAYEGSQNAEDLVLRVLLFRFFNKTSTWNALEEAFGEVNAREYNVDRFCDVLDDMLSRKARVYSAAYIIPPPPFGAVRKHKNHLLLIDHMLASGLPKMLAKADSLRSVFEIIQSYPSLGPFLAYQLTVDFNYTTLIDFDENDFVVAGPGAISGIQKCFPEASRHDAPNIIEWMVNSQREQCSTYQLDFEDLFGRPLTLIDCQNLFCETDKYARVMHPDVTGKGNRTRIKQKFLATSDCDVPFFPPKWGINELRRASVPLFC